MNKKYSVYMAKDEMNVNTDNVDFYTFVGSLIFYLINKDKYLCVEWIKRLCKGSIRTLKIKYNGDEEKWEF